MSPEQIQLLVEWELALMATKEAKLIIAKELKLRKEVIAALFPLPNEGTNILDLSSGWRLKYIHKLERKLDEAVLPAVNEQLRTLNVNLDTLVYRVPVLDLQQYRTLCTISPQAALIFDQALTIKPASPTLELVPPK